MTHSTAGRAGRPRLEQPPLAGRVGRRVEPRTIVGRQGPVQAVPPGEHEEDLPDLVGQLARAGHAAAELGVVQLAAAGPADAALDPAADPGAVEPVEALGAEREALWARLGDASFLTDAEKRKMAGIEPERAP